MKEIVEDLARFGFTPTEGEVYAVLVMLGCANGSQVARKMNISRSSVYQALNSLFKKGIIYLKQGSTAEYIPKEPRHLIAGLQNEYERAASDLKDKLQSLEKQEEGHYFTNISGMENIDRRVSEMIQSSAFELLINTSLSLERFRNDIIDATERGVRIIVFSFDQISMGNLPVEFFCNSVDEECCTEERLQVVADFNSVLIASSSVKSHEAVGTYTKNPIQVALVSEHIHHDIYMLKIEERYGSRIFDSEIKINSLMEKMRGIS